ncbi:MAG: sigma 54-interacting transcriptional regulator [Acidobacteriaceae bacterium]
MTAGSDIHPGPVKPDAWLRRVVDSTPALLDTARADGSFDFFNQSWLSFVGASEEKLLGWGWTAFIHPEDLDSLLCKWKESVARGVSFEAEARVRRADGEYRWMLHRGVCRPQEDGQAVRWFGSSAEIEDQKRTEDSLRLAETYTMQVQRVAGITGWVIEPPDTIVYWTPGSSDSGADFTQRPPNKLAEYTLRVHPEDRAKVTRAQEKLLSGEPASCTYREVENDRAMRVVRAVGAPIRANGIVTHCVGATIDITEQEEMTRQLERSHAYLTEAQRLSHTGSVGWKLATDEHIWSEETYRIFEIDPGKPPRYEMILDRIHPEDRASALESLAMASRGVEKLDFEHRLLLPDGRIKYLHLVAHRLPILTAGAEYVGAVMDVTTQKAAEESIRRREAELRQIVDAVPQQVFVFDADWTPIFANKQEQEYNGLTEEAARSKSAVLELFHPDDRNRVVEARQRASLNGAQMEIEARIRRSDGQYRWFLIRDNPLCDDQGRALRWYGARTDVDDRKQAEQSLERENIALRQEVSEASMFEEVIGSSVPLRAVLSRVAKVANADSTVLILGETGTGKELIARAIHRLSRRASRAFVTVNCASIPHDLISSELFGHEKGSFTGAIQRRLGRFELADGGSIFLDEIGDLPLDMQSALLRVLQEHEFERVGGNRSISTNVRVIAATNRDLTSAIAAGSFRSDLFYRLNVFPIDIPPLRQRREDIPLLVKYFADRFARKAGKSIRTISRRSMELLQAYNWPGNIRELQNVIERSVILSESGELWVDEYWFAQQEAVAEKPVRAALPGIAPLPDDLSEHAREMIESALEASKGRVSGPSGAAARLGVPRSTLESKIRALNIDKKRFRAEGASLPA